MKRKKTRLLAILMVISLLAGCAPAGAEKKKDDPKKSDKNSLKVAMKTEPISMDPHVGNDSNTSTALMLSLEGLLNIVDGEVKPGVAERYEVSDDGLVYTFYLRDSKWQDGKPVIAQDFVDTWIRMLTRQDAMDLAYLIFPIKNAAAVSNGEKDVSELGCKAINDKTLEVTLESAYPFMVSLFASTPMYPIRNDLADEFGTSYGSSPDKFVGNGPYILKEWKHNDRMVFEKNPDYWDADNIHIPEITLLLVADDNTIKNMYDTGEIHFMEVGSNMVSSYEDSPEFQYYNSGGVQFLCLSLKGTSDEAAKIISNRNFQMALSCAIDRQALVDSMFPMNLPFTGVINPEISDGKGGKWGDTYDVTDKFHKVNGDIEEAKKYMDAACKELGYASAEEMPEFDLLTTSGEEDRTLCEYFQNVWKENLGVSTSIRQLEFAQYYENLYGAPYDICRTGWGPDYDDPFTYLDMWDSRGGWNKTGWIGENYYTLITEANKQSDPNKRNEMFAEAEEILLTEAPIIPLYLKRGAYVMDSGIEDVFISSFGARFDFRYATIK